MSGGDRRGLRPARALPDGRGRDRRRLESASTHSSGVAAPRGQRRLVCHYGSPPERRLPWLVRAVHGRLDPQARRRRGPSSALLQGLRAAAGRDGDERVVAAPLALRRGAHVSRRCIHGFPDFQLRLSRERPAARVVPRGRWHVPIAVAGPSRYLDLPIYHLETLRPREERERKASVRAGAARGCARRARLQPGRLPPGASGRAARGRAAGGCNARSTCVSPWRGRRRGPHRAAPGTRRGTRSTCALDGLGGGTTPPRCQPARPPRRARWAGACSSVELRPQPQRERSVSRVRSDRSGATDRREAGRRFRRRLAPGAEQCARRLARSRPAGQRTRARRP